ncbi:MAG: GGDEF domain-containing protein [Burkholderiales bacterium]
MLIPLMSKQAAGVHPISYAVWYEYVSGGNLQLREEIDSLTNEGRKLDDESVRRLHEKYVADLSSSAVTRLGDSLKRVVSQVSASTGHVGEEAIQYGDKLDKMGQRLEADDVAQVELQGMVKAAFRDTAQMRATMSTVQERLASSQNEIEDLRKELDRVREEALQDGLTGLLNRRAFDDQIGALVKGSAGKGETFAVILSDIDHFKRINDGYGHLFGDRVIRAVGEALKAGVKGKDSVARYGGEEFAILLPATPASGAWAVAEGVRRLVASSRIRRLNNDEVVGNITISSGVAVHRAGESISSLLERADAALYRAKRGGRNRVETAE